MESLGQGEGQVSEVILGSGQPTSVGLLSGHREHVVVAESCHAYPRIHLEFSHKAYDPGEH
jgi:hypothetical protein